MRTKANGRGSIAGLSFEGKLSDIQNNIPEAELHFVTVVPRGTARHGLDVVSSGYFLVGAADRVAEAGSTDARLVVTGHDFKKGDLVRIKTSAGAVDEDEIFIRSIVDANTVEFDGLLSAALQAGDTVDVLRGVSPLYGSDGSISASVTPSPIIIQRGPGGVYADTEVTKDTTVPANTIPIPVEIVGSTGTEVNITAGDIGVQLFHNTASPDSVQIGDGTEIMLVSTSGEALTQPNGNVAANAADSGNPIKIGGVYDAALPTYDDGDRTNLQTDANGRILVADSGISSATFSFAEDSAASDADPGLHLLSVRQDTLAGSSTTDGDYQSIKSTSTGEVYVADSAARTSLASIAAEDFATETTLAALNAKFNSLGQKARAASAPVTLSTEDIAAITGGAGSTAYAQDAAFSGGDLGSSILSRRQDTLAGTTTTDGDYDNFKSNNVGEIYVIDSTARTSLASIAAEDFSTETTLAALNAKFGAIGQQARAASAAVTLSSEDIAALSPGATGDVLQAVATFANSLNDNAGAFTQLLADSGGAAVTGIQIMQKGGEPLELALGASSSEVVKLIVMPGGSPDVVIPVNIPVNSRISARSASGNSVASVDIFFNLIG